MENSIALALSKMFERHRIVFWYDAKQELRGEYEALEIPAVSKIELQNNEFGIKYRILRQQPTDKFLLYQAGPQPPDIENWLLDVQLTGGTFRTDQVALWLGELSLGPEYAAVLTAHAEFFRAVKRKEILQRILTAQDSDRTLRLKMVAVCAGAEPTLEAVMENLLAELAEGRDEKFRLICRCNLDAFLWEQLQRTYAYVSNAPGLRDFAISLFQSCYALGTDGAGRMNGDALVFLRNWKDSRRHAETFEILSGECAEVLDIERDLEKRDFRTLFELDYFRMIDQKIISELVQAVAARTVSAGDVSQWVRHRRQGRWYAEFRDLYEATEAAAQFMAALDAVQLTIESLSDGLERYVRSWFRLDQLYRQFVCPMRRSGNASLLGPLAERVENLYVNNYLLKLNDRWQSFVDVATTWEAPPAQQQDLFFRQCVQPFLKKENKIFVIISDALRYEIGEELLGLIRQEDRFEAELEPMLARLPSYTQLGMAALLPNSKLALGDDDSGAVLVDGESSQGTANRLKILSQAVLPRRAMALRAEEVLALNKDECRALVRDHDVVYIFHNRIDVVGDKRETEDRVFEAVAETLQELVRLVKKLAAANANNFLVTADHGFLYQHRPIEESDFSGAEVVGTEIMYRDRRFVLGKGLRENSGLKKFASAGLGLTGQMEVQIPKSINRLRLQGSGSRFVHGGATLQEVVTPILRINKKRQSDVAPVEVEILRGGSSMITSGQLAVTLYQAQAVEEKVQPRELRAGIYSLTGELISDRHQLKFDMDSENPRQRELPVRFVLSRKADESNGQEVYLRLEEKVGETSHYREYKSLPYVIRRSFTSDFDF